MRFFFLKRKCMQYIRAWSTIKREYIASPPLGDNHACAKHKIKGFAIAWFPEGKQSSGTRLQSIYPLLKKYQEYFKSKRGWLR